MAITNLTYNQLVKDLLANSISIDGLMKLRKHITPQGLSEIITHIYDLNETAVLKIALLDGLLKKFDDKKNARRNSRFTKKMESGFRTFVLIIMRINSETKLIFSSFERKMFIY